VSFPFPELLLENVSQVRLLWPESSSSSSSSSSCESAEALRKIKKAL